MAFFAIPLSCTEDIFLALAFALRDLTGRVSVAAMGILFYCLFALSIGVFVSLRFYSQRFRLQTANQASNWKAIADVNGISVFLDIDDRKSLFVLVAEDGSINRMGSGTLDTTDQGLLIGKTDPAVFAAVRSHLSEAMLQITGRTFEAKNPRGTACKLKILWQFRDGTSGGFVFCYGAESEGPPGFVADFVRAAVNETDRWHAAQRKP